MSVAAVTTPKKFTGFGKVQGLWPVLVVVGLVTGVLSYKNGELGAQRFWANFLLEYFFWFSIAMGGIFFATLQHLTGSYWSVTLRRIPEVFSSYLPVSFVLFFILLLGLPHLYEWTHPDVVAADALLTTKSAYLNTPFMIVRHLALYATLFILGGWMVRNSIRQDQNRDARLTQLNVKIAAPFMLLFGWLFTFVSFDLIMSLSPHWFSTIFGIYCWAGLFYSTLAMITLWVVILKRQGVLAGFVTEDHLHDMGKLMFAFLVFWGYIAFSQFVLIWYANQPEETVYYMNRMGQGWMCVSLILVFGKFVIPFFILISRGAKRKEGILIFMAIWFLLAQWFDLYWMIFPNFFRNGPVFGWVEVGMACGFLGLFFMTVGRSLRKVSPVAIGDPRLDQSLHHHQ